MRHKLLPKPLAGTIAAGCRAVGSGAPDELAAMIQAVGRGAADGADDDQLGNWLHARSSYTARYESGRRGWGVPPATLAHSYAGSALC